MNIERKRGGKGMARTEVVAVRFDPRTKYLIEIAARVQRRSAANYVEWAVEESFKHLDMRRQDGEPETVEAAGRVLWHVDEVRRLALLKRLYPHLLTFEEERLLPLLQEATAALGGKWTETGERHTDLLSPHLALLKQAAADGKSVGDIEDELRPPMTRKSVGARKDHLKSQLAELEKLEKSLPPDPAAIDDDLRELKGRIDNVTAALTRTSRQTATKKAK